MIKSLFRKPRMGLQPLGHTAYTLTERSFGSAAPVVAVVVV